MPNLRKTLALAALCGVFCTVSIAVAREAAAISPAASAATAASATAAISATSATSAVAASSSASAPAAPHAADPFAPPPVPHFLLVPSSAPLSMEEMLRQVREAEERAGIRRAPASAAQ
ncbi:hypothetical protein [Candidatus Symbiobacter mobilis]|uniref:Uncharacterized protein n=1 Tax=Candidatus Symbiobacter mobilis CR TaxID=946483 RepID=U5N9C5_9BURK|nr:hypothetical protein [Candidatus Symbiobacter mobilis]AGX88171.1 hypothetical protein Cenrod_2100 [Candidatus Symbiobacter mobilis CR]